MSDKPEAPEKIWLIDVDGDEFFKNYVWCDDPAPSPGMEPKESVEYIRADLLQDKIAELEEVLKKIGDSAGSWRRRANGHNCYATAGLQSINDILKTRK